MYGMKKGGSRKVSHKSGAMADHAGGGMGVAQKMSKESNVSLGAQKMVNFMSDSGHTAPKLNNDKAHDFRPGGEVSPQ